MSDTPVRDLSATKAAKTLGVARSTLTRYFKLGAPHDQVGQSKRVNVDELRAWVLLLDLGHGGDRRDGLSVSVEEGQLAADRLAGHYRRTGGFGLQDDEDDPDEPSMSVKLKLVRIRRTRAAAAKAELELEKLRAATVPAAEVIEGHRARVDYAAEVLNVGLSELAAALVGEDLQAVEGLMREWVYGRLSDLSAEERAG
jgi:hypothetical protein